MEALSPFQAAALIIIAHKHNYRDFCPRDWKANGLIYSPYVSVKTFWCIPKISIHRKACYFLILWNFTQWFLSMKTYYWMVKVTCNSHVQGFMESNIYIFNFFEKKERSYLVCLNKAEKYSLIWLKLVLLITVSQKKYLKTHTSRELLTSSPGVTAEKPEASIWGYQLFRRFER